MLSFAQFVVYEKCLPWALVLIGFPHSEMRESASFKWKTLNWCKKKKKTASESEVQVFGQSLGTGRYAVAK